MGSSGNSEGVHALTPAPARCLPQVQPINATVPLRSAGAGPGRARVESPGVPLPTFMSMDSGCPMPPAAPNTATLRGGSDPLEPFVARPRAACWATCLRSPDMMDRATRHRNALPEHWASGAAAVPRDRRSPRDTADGQRALASPAGHFGWPGGARWAAFTFSSASRLPRTLHPVARVVSDQFPPSPARPGSGGGR